LPIVVACSTVSDLAGINLALNKPAIQVSTASTKFARLAVDGLRSTRSGTQVYQHPWLSVDLGQPYDIGQVTVTNNWNPDRSK